MNFINKLLRTVLLLVWVNATGMNNGGVKFDEMEYFNQKMIMENALIEIRLQIYTHPKTIGEPDSCYNSISKFDYQGRLIEQDLSRLSSVNYFKYDGDKLSDWGWREKSTGELTSFVSELQDDPNELKQQKQQTIQTLQRRLSAKEDFHNKHIRKFEDPCLTVDGDYEIQFESSASLPVKAVASLASKENNSNSPAKLFLYFEYVAYK